MKELNPSRYEPDAEKRLTTFIDMHSQLSETGDQKDIAMYIQGGETEAIKADILMNLELVELDPAIQCDNVVATRGLLD